MNTIEIEATRLTPYVKVDAENGRVILSGRSSPSNPLEFYTPIITAFQHTHISETIHVDFKLEYFNTSSTKCLFMIFQRLGELKKKGYDVRVDWYAEEDDFDLIETGEDFEELSELDFNFILE